VTFLYYSDAGLDFYSNSIIVSRRSSAASIPDRIAGLARGVRARLARRAQGPARGHRVAGQGTSRSPSPSSSFERLTWLIKNQVRSPDVDAGGLGALNPAKLARGIDQVAEAFGLAAKPAAGDRLHRRLSAAARAPESLTDGVGVAIARRRQNVRAHSGCLPD